MGAKLAGTRAQKSDVGRIGKTDTGTALPPIKKDSTIDGTRVKDANMADRLPMGSPSQKESSRMKGTRVRGTPVK